MYANSNRFDRTPLNAAQLAEQLARIRPGDHILVTASKTYTRDKVKTCLYHSAWVKAEDKDSPELFTTKALILTHQTMDKNEAAGEGLLALLTAMPNVHTVWTPNEDLARKCKRGETPYCAPLAQQRGGVNLVALPQVNKVSSRQEFYRKALAKVEKCLKARVPAKEKKRKRKDFQGQNKKPKHNKQATVRSRLKPLKLVIAP
jgi:hypothetical protein